MKRRAVTLVVGLACIVAAGTSTSAAVAAYPTADDFTDWTSVDGTPAVATGTLDGSAITLSGTHVFAPPISVVDGHWTFNAGPDFSPPLTKTDVIQIGANSPPESYTLTFGTPVTDPVIEIGSLGSTLDFPAGTQITKIVGQSGFTVSGSSVIGTPDPNLGPDGINDSNGTIQLSGTFASISFTATSTAAPQDDGVLLQVGAAPPEPLPPPTTTTTPSGGGGTGGAGGAAPPPPPPRVTSLHIVGGAGTATRSLVKATLGGQANELQWYVAGLNHPVLTGSAALSTLRFRPSPNGSVVGVRAIGPGGSSPLVQTSVPALALPDGAVAKKIGRAVSAGGSVFFASSNPGFVLKGGRGLATCKLFPPARISAEGGLLDISGCTQPLTGLSELPTSLQGIVVDMARRYGIPLNASDVNLGLNLSDAYRAIGPVLVNGMTIDPGLDGMVIFPQIHLIAATSASLSVGGIKLANPLPGPFEIDTTPRGGRIPFGTFHSIPGAALVPGFGVFGDVSVTAVPPAGGLPAATAITTQLHLPSWLTVAGVGADATVDMRATTDSGLVLDSMQTRVRNLNIGPVLLKDFRIKYTRAPSDGLPGDRWEGQGIVCLPIGSPCIDMAPPHGGVRIVGGNPDFIGASVPFNPPVTLFPGLDLSRIGFAFGLNPTRFLVTTAKLIASDVLSIDGRMVIAFPSHQQPYTLEHDASFLDPPPAPRPFPPAQYGIPHTGFTLGASAQTALRLPVIGEVPLGNAYFLYEYPGYISVGGGIQAQSLLGVGEVSGGISGEINFTNHRFDIFGKVEVCTGIDCPDGFFAVKYGGDANFSDVGMSICVRPSLLPDFGIGIYWPGRFPTDWRFQGPGCRWSPFADKNVHGSAVRGRARQAAATLPYTFTVHRGDPGLSIRLAGSDGAPRVRVIAPGGDIMDSPNGDGAVGREQLMIIRFDRARITSVGMRHGVPGRYRIEALPGSPPVSQIATATPLPDARITAAVHGNGIHRVLSYDIAPRPEQQVHFLEVTASGAARTIATVNRAGRGTLRFMTTPGIGTRTIVARFELSGLPAERVTVARFQPPSPRLGRISKLRVARRGTSLRARWAGVSGASAYELALTGDGASQRRLRVRGTSATLRGVATATAGRVSVRAVDTLRQGPTANAGFRATSRPRTRVRRLPKAPRLR